MFARFFPPLSPREFLGGAPELPFPPTDADEYDCWKLFADCVCDAGAGPRLLGCLFALKLEMNSKLAADSPRKFLKSSAAPSGDIMEALAWRSLRSSSGR